MRRRSAAAHGPRHPRGPAPAAGAQPHGSLPPALTLNPSFSVRQRWRGPSQSLLQRARSALPLGWGRRCRGRARGRDERLPGRGQGRLSPARCRFRRAAGDAAPSWARRRDYLTIRVLASDMTRDGARRPRRRGRPPPRHRAGRGRDAPGASCAATTSSSPGTGTAASSTTARRCARATSSSSAEVIRNLTNRGDRASRSPAVSARCWRAPSASSRPSCSTRWTWTEHEALEYLDDLLEEIAHERQAAAGRATT